MESTWFKKIEEKKCLPHELAMKSETEIKNTIINKFSEEPESLCLLLDDKSGVYLSEKEIGTLCCFVVSRDKGYLYLVTAKLTENGCRLDNFKAEIVS